MSKPSAIERIKDAALRLVVERGVGGTTIRDLAQMAGVAEGALYRHYATKEDLIRELFRERYAAYARRLELVQAKERGLRAKLRAIVRDTCRLFDDDQVTYRFLLLAQHGSKLAPGLLESLTQRTEGWAAGLRLAAMSLSAHPDPGQFVKELVTEDSALTGYLVDEVIKVQSPEVREVLLSTSILEHFSTDAAVELAGDEQAPPARQQQQVAIAPDVLLRAFRTRWRRGCAQGQQRHGVEAGQPTDGLELALILVVVVRLDLDGEGGRRRCDGYADHGGEGRQRELRPQRREMVLLFGERRRHGAGDGENRSERAAPQAIGIAPAGATIQE